MMENGFNSETEPLLTKECNTKSEEKCVDNVQPHYGIQEKSKTTVGDKPLSCFSRVVCNPTTAVHRYTVLVFICLIGVGDYFVTDNPAALQKHFLDDLDISETQYMGFYSNIQWTGIFACLFGGYLVDKVFKNRVGITLFSFLLTLADALFASGALFGSYWTMWVARGLHGVARSPMLMAVEKLLVKWFKSKELYMVLGFKTSIARAGSVINMNVMGPIYDYISQFVHGHVCLGIALFAGVLVCFLSFLSAMVVAILDNRADTIIEATQQIKEKPETIQISDVKSFPLTYWLIALTLTIYYLALFPFVGLGQVFFEMKYDKSPHEADTINSMVYLMAAVTMPVFGLAIDKVGRSLLWMFLGIVLSLGSHALMTFTFVEPFLPAVCLGLGYSVFTATMWPMTAYVIATSHLGTAYGIMNTVIAIGQAGITYLTGYIVDTKGYYVLQVFFTGSMAVALIIATILYIVDKSKGGELNLSTQERLEQYDRVQISKENPTTDTTDQQATVADASDTTDQQATVADASDTSDQQTPVSVADASDATEEHS